MARLDCRFAERRQALRPHGAGDAGRRRAFADDPDALRATGYLVRSWYKFNRNKWLDDAIEHTGKAFLGVTFNCCRCHDHMYDPLAQRDYYALRAFFEPYDVRTDRLPGEPDTLKVGLARVFDGKPDDPDLFVYSRQRQEPGQG